MTTAASTTATGASATGTIATTTVTTSISLLAGANWSFAIEVWLGLIGEIAATFDG